MWRSTATTVSAVAFALIALTTSVPPIAHADPNGSAGTERSYDDLIADAVREFDAGHWEEARALFLHAHELKPSARTLRGLGFAEFELRHYLRADQFLRQALVDTRNTLIDKQRREIDGVLVRIQNFLGRYRIASTPAATTILVDGAAPQLGADGSILLEAGGHVLTFNAPSFAELERRIDVGGGEQETLRVQLLPLATPADAHSALASDSGNREGAASDRAGATQRILGWTAVGAGVLGLGVGLVFEVQRSNKLGDADAVCPSDDCGTITAMQFADNMTRIHELTHDANSSGTIAAIAIATGGALAAGGLVLVFTAPNGDQQMAIAPVVAPGAYALTASGRFF